MGTGKWTDEKMIQVYDLQERYTECVVDFVRHGFEGDVFKFLQLIPALNGYEQTQEQDIFRRAEFIKEYGEEFEPQGRYIYKDLFNQWEGADTLREVFEEKYQWEFTEAHPASLALFAGSKEIAMESYTIEQYDRIRNEIPFRLMDRVQELIEEYPREIQDKACRQAIYGYTNVISSNGTTKSPFTNANELLAYIVLKLMYRTPSGTVKVPYDSK